jgi:hypothetical protein
VCVCYQFVFSFAHAYSKYTGTIWKAALDT